MHKTSPDRPGNAPAASIPRQYTDAAKTPVRIAVGFPGHEEAQRWAEALSVACAAIGLDVEVLAWPQRPDSGSQGTDTWPQGPGAGPGAQSAPRRSGHQGADYALGWLTPGHFFRENPQLKAFFNAGAGVDAILDAGVVPLELPIYRLEDAGMGLQMAQYCALECLQRLGQRDEYCADQKLGRWQPRPPLNAADFPVGVVGMGVLGTQVAAALRRLGFPVHGFRRDPSVRQQDCFAGKAQWEAFLAATRILILLAPLTAETRGMIDAHALRQLQPDAWVINVARGPLIVERDLLAALEGSTLAGATLDVFATEPLPPESPLWTHPKVRITPHVAASTLIGPAVHQIAVKLGKILAGEEASGRVERSRAY